MCESEAVNEPRSPLDLLGRLGTDEVTLAPGVRLIEAYTMPGILQLLWSGPPDAADVVLLAGGALGGLLGPAGAIYPELGRRIADDDVATIAVNYRRPDKPDSCLLDVAATADWAMRQGAERFVTVGHSFGGAVAIQTAAALQARCAGVVTLATQSAGGEAAAELHPETPLLLLHGDQDQMLGPENSSMVQAMAGRGDLRVLHGTGHGLVEAREPLLELLVDWIRERFAEHRGAAESR